MKARAVEAVQVGINTIITVTTASLLYLPGPLTRQAGRDAWLAVLLGTLLGAAFARGIWAAYFRPNRAPGEPATGGRATWSSRLLALAFGTYAIYLGVLLVAQVATVFTTVLPEMPIAIFAAGTALTGWTIAAYGREALFRTGQLFFPMMIVGSLLNLAVALAGNVDLRELLPVMESGLGPVLAAVPLVFAFGSEVLVVATAAGAVRDPRHLARSLPLAVGLSGLLLAAYTATATAILGSQEVARSTFPVLAVIRQVRVSLFLLRLEILTLFAWLTGAFVKEGLLLAAAGEGMRRALGLGERWRATITGGASAVTAVLGVEAFGNAPALLEHIARTFPLVGGAAGGMFLVAGLLATRKRERRGGRYPSGGAILALLLMASLAAGGCYGRVEPEQAAVTTVLGLDRGPGNGVRLTAEVVGAPAGAPSEQAGSVSHQLLRAEGRSVLDAQRHLELGAAREVLWSHINVVVVGRELAAAGLRPALDSLTRRYTFRRNAFLFVADGQAGQLLQELTPVFAASRFVAFQRVILRPSARVGSPSDLNAFLRALGHEGEDPYLPVVTVSSPEAPEPELKGAALFRDDRLAALLDEAATRGLYWLTGQKELSRLLWPCPDQPAARGLGVSAIRSYATRRVHVDAFGPQVTARVGVEADVEEWQCAVPLSPAALTAAERLAEDVVRNEIETLLAATRVAGVDPAGFGMELRRTDPAGWASVRGSWRDWLQRLPARVQVEVELRRTGLTLDPP